MICAWPLTLKNPCANMDPNLFFQKCKQQYWDKLNEVKTTWVSCWRRRAVNTLKVHIVLHEPLSGLLCMCNGIKKMFRKLLKILNQQDPNFFSVCFIRAMVCVPLPTFFCSFSTLAHKVNEAWKWHKIEKFDLWPQFTSCANEGPSSFHLHLLLSS